MIRIYKRTLEVPILASWSHSPIYKIWKRLQFFEKAPKNENLGIDLIWSLGKGSVIRNCGQTLEIPVLASWSHSPIYKNTKRLQVFSQGFENYTPGIDLFGWSKSNKVIEEAASVAGTGHSVSRRRPEKAQPFTLPDLSLAFRLVSLYQPTGPHSNRSRP